MSELPLGWAQVLLEDVVEILDARRVPINARERERRVKDKDKTELYPYYGATGQAGYIDDFLFDESLILLGEDGVSFFDPLRTKAYQVSGKFWVNNHAHVLRARIEVADQRYIAAFLNSFNYTGYISGSTRLKLTQAAMRTIPIPLAPLNEQKRIADKLDRLLARVDACRERCDRIPLILKRFRQSVLTAATSGELTEDWRTSKETDQWQSVSLSDVCLSITDGDHQAPPQVQQGIPFITIAAINDGKLRLDKATRFVSQEYFEQRQPSRKPQLGDVLFSVTGSIAIPALVDTDELFTFQRHIAILKPDLSKISSRFLFYSLGTEKIKNQSLSVATGTAQLTIPLSGLRRLVIDLPTKDEQDEIVRQVETLFVFADRLEARYQNAHAQVGRLTPALLDKTFQGELVPQDPNDEPASVLLEQISNIRARDEQARQVQKRGVASQPSKQTKEDIMVELSQIQPNHLTAILKEKGSISPVVLWQASQLRIEDFYEQLRTEEINHLLREVRNGNNILLEAA